MTTGTRRIAVTGARGRLGGQVCSLLSGEGVEVVPVTRATADYDDPPALRAALAGADTLVLVSSDGESDRVLQHHLNLVGACADTTVRQVVALSSIDADVDSPFCYARVNALTEAALGRLDAAVSTVRASLFAEFLASLVDLATVGEELRLPAADGRVALVSREDVGRVLAALALTPSPGVHPVTGPRSLSMAEVAAARGLTYVPVGEAEFAACIARHESAWWSYAYTSMFGSIREQRWDVVTDEVEQITGRPAAQLG